MDGSATFVTGGALVESKTENPSEIRAKQTTGGMVNHLTKGDVIVIPVVFATQANEWLAVFLIGFAGAAHQSWSARSNAVWSELHSTT